MTSLSQKQLLELWEQGRYQTHMEFCLKALCKALPNLNYDQALLLPIGIRDSLVLKLRHTIFGNILYNTSFCPSCKEKVEWEMAISSLGLPESFEIEYARNYEFRKGNYFITYRLPNTADILQLPCDSFVDAADKWLLSRCILEIKQKRKILGYEDLTQDLLQDLNEQMSEKDEFADIRMAVSCNQCSCQWENLFDIIDYFWIETNAWAMNELHEIGTIAYHFGWSESQIMELSPSRRRIYLEMIKA